MIVPFQTKLLFGRHLGFFFKGTSHQLVHLVRRVSALWLLRLGWCGRWRLQHVASYSCLRRPRPSAAAFTADGWCATAGRWRRADDGLAHVRPLRPPNLLRVTIYELVLHSGELFISYGLWDLLRPFEAFSRSRENGSLERLGTFFSSTVRWPLPAASMAARQAYDACHTKQGQHLLRELPGSKNPSLPLPRSPAYSSQALQSEKVPSDSSKGLLALHHPMKNEHTPPPCSNWKNAFSWRKNPLSLFKFFWLRSRFPG